LASRRALRWVIEKHETHKAIKATVKQGGIK
jgi:hypothetical protein